MTAGTEPGDGADVVASAARGGYRNHWVAPPDPVASWVVELPVAAGREALAEWVRGSVEALGEFPVWRAEELGSLGYRRADDGPLAPFLERRFADDGVADLFAFAGDSAPVHVVSRLAWYPADDSPPATGLVDAVGALLSDLRPDDAAQGVAWMSGMPPLWVSGRRILPGERPSRPWTRVAIDLHSEIWLPWVRGFLDDKPEPGRDASDAELDRVWWFDNRELADFHTPALNAALAALGESAERLGGRLALHEEPTLASSLGQVTDEGVVLGAPPPQVGPPRRADA